MAEDEVEQRDSSAVLLASVETRPLTAIAGGGSVLVTYLITNS